MKEIVPFKSTLKARLLLVLAAFLLMVVSSASIMYYTLNQKLLTNAEATMDDTQTLFSRILREPIGIVHMIAGNIEGIYNRSEGIETVKAYISEISGAEYIDRIHVHYNRVYGYFDVTDEFYDGLGWIPDETYNLKERPWYTSAQGSVVGVSEPYIDIDTGKPIISYSRNIYDNAGDVFGTIAVDVFVDYLRNLVVNKQITPGSYGYMVDKNLRLVMHPNPAIEGEMFGESNTEMLQFIDQIREGRSISLQTARSIEGVPSIIFGRQLENGWYFFLMIPRSEYYGDLYTMLWLMSILGVLLTTVLIIILARLENIKRRLDMGKLENALKQAEIANKAKSEFLARMSHEIRTPMNSILGIAEIQLLSENVSPEDMAVWERVHGSGDMLLGIINDILDLSKIEAGKLEIINRNYEIASLISDTAQLNIIRIGSKPIEFELHVDENIPAVLFGDELRMKQILNNLLSNAFKYTDKGKVTFNVCAQNGTQLTTPDTAGGDIVTLVFKVSDTGQGMSKEQLAKLFDEYSRFNKEINHSTEGTGLGMSITRNLVKMMNGEIDIESEPGKGTAVTVSIPQVRIGAEALGAEIAENLTKFRANNNSRMKRIQITREPMPYGSVLIVDDVETNIYVAKGLMTPYKLKIDSAESGYDAIEKVKAGNIYDIVFMDHMMPDMDGIETTKRIREMGYKHPIVALTANAVTGQAEMFLKSGFDDFISKPIDIRQLNAALNSFIRDKQPQEVIEQVRKEYALSRESADNDTVAAEADTILKDSFIRDAKKALVLLTGLFQNEEIKTEEGLGKYTISVHGLKSSLANIGRQQLSDIALRLEEAGKEKNMDYILSETPGFITQLHSLSEQLKSELSDEDNDFGQDDTEELFGILASIKEMCDDFNRKGVLDILAGIGNCSKQTKQALEGIKELVSESEFEKAADAAEAYANTLRCADDHS